MQAAHSGRGGIVTANNPKESAMSTPLPTTRRGFIRTVPILSIGPLAALPPGWAQAAPAVSPDDPQAQTLGYVADASKADRNRFKQYAAGQHCGACGLYQGAANSASGPCPIFPGKEVRSTGWCSAFARKA